MTPVLLDTTIIYLGSSLLATLLYTLFLHVRNMSATLSHITIFGFTYTIVWPGLTAILSILGIWYRLLPSSSSAFAIAAGLTAIPAAALTSLTASDLSSPPLARKADRPAIPPPPSEPPPPPRTGPKWRH